MIPFNKPTIIGKEEVYIQEVLQSYIYSGDGPFTEKCHKWFEMKLSCQKALLTTSCTHALELAAILVDVQEGDEIIMPSYTFVSTANAFVLRGAKIIFVDIRPDTMNIDETKIEAAITQKTKVIVPVHYGGVACEMDKIMEIANKYNLIVIEDAAQGVMSTYNNRPLGTIGHLGCFSFHETKNYTCGEGGALLINDTRFVKRAEIIREKGTNRSEFFRGQIDKYTWVDKGSSFLPSEFNAAFLLAQLEHADLIKNKRLQIWNLYLELLSDLEEVELPVIPELCGHNAHIFYIKVKNLQERSKLLEFLKEKDIQCVFHYVPLHSSKAGKVFGEFSGPDLHTTKESERLLRLPIFFDLTLDDARYVVNKIKDFYMDIR